MKKTTLTVVLAGLCLIFKVEAQSNKAANVNTPAIQMGQHVPDITITNLHNYKDKEGKPATKAKLSDFKGKLLIIDFWATWCSPCIAMIPKMDSLQKQFGDKIQFLSVTYQSEKDVLPYLKKFEEQQDKNYDLPVITSDTSLKTLFPHRTLPHYVWIDTNGRVRAKTTAEEVNYRNILATLNEQSPVLREKIDFNVFYDEKKPLMAPNNAYTADDLLYHSSFFKNKEGLKSQFSILQSDSLNSYKITCTNLSFVDLFRFAYGGGSVLYNKNRMILDIKDTTVFTRSVNTYREWIKNNGLSYELIVPRRLSDKAFEIMRNDIKRIFPQYDVSLKSQKTKCLVLIRTSKQDKVKTLGEKADVKIGPFGGYITNMPLSHLVMQLTMLYQQNSPWPVFDETNYNNHVDLKLDANLSDIESINKSLEKYDLRLVLKEKEIGMLVFKDSGKSPLF